MVKQKSGEGRVRGESERRDMIVLFELWFLGVKMLKMRKKTKKK